MSTLDAAAAVQSLFRRTVEVFTREELLAKLRGSLSSGRPLRVKLGMDPTAPDVHLGHVVVLQKLRDFQDLGHTAVLIIGDATAAVGDPSGRDTTRPPLDRETIESNARTYLDQVGRILRSDRLEVRRNSEWLDAMQLPDILRLMSHTTVARMLERDNFALRLEAQRSISLHELMYPLMQAHDSVAIDADVELGGTDQTFNTLMGREIMRDQGLDPQVVVTLPLLRGLDGTEKMSKSLGNYIGVTDPAATMVQRIFGMEDGLMESYFDLLTDVPAAQVRKRLVDGEDPPALKRLLARLVASRFHPDAAVEQALADIDRAVPEVMEETEIPASERKEGERIWVVRLAVLCGFARSNREARPRIEQGAMRIDGEVVAGADVEVAIQDGTTVSFGNPRKKTNWRRLRLLS